MCEHLYHLPRWLVSWSLCSGRHIGMTKSLLMVTFGRVFASQGWPCRGRSLLGPNFFGPKLTHLFSFQSFFWWERWWSVLPLSRPCACSSPPSAPQRKPSHQGICTRPPEGSKLSFAVNIGGTLMGSRSWVAKSAAAAKAPLASYFGFTDCFTLNKIGWGSIL